MPPVDFADFYRTSRDVCLRAVMATAADPALAEDLVAEAFTRAWMRWTDVSRHPSPRAWIVRTALNAHVSWWRRRRREVPLAIGGLIVAPPAAAAIDPGLLQALQRLPRRQREVIALRVFLDLNVRETAKTLAISEGTVTAHLSRAIATLRTHFVLEERQEVVS